MSNNRTPSQMASETMSIGEKSGVGRRKEGFPIPADDLQLLGYIGRSMATSPLIFAVQIDWLYCAHLQLR